MEIIPAISTAPTRETRLWTGSYDDYLQSSHWRKTRDAALRRAGWKCSRCPAQRTLQVHHRTYDRLGAEFDADLEVLCATCHEGHHYDTERKEHLGLYVKVVSTVLKAGTDAGYADVAEATKAECARLKIPYDANKIHRALTLLDARIPVDSATFRGAWQAPPAHDAPLTHTEACQLLEKVGLKVPVRTVPRGVTEPTPFQWDKLRAAQLVAQAIAESIARCEALEQAAEKSRVASA